MRAMLKADNHRVLLSPPHMCGRELEFINEAFESNFVAPAGPMIDAFEQEFADLVGVPYAAAVSSGTAALHLVLRLLGVGRGQEVWTSTLTFIGGVSPICQLGAKPVFIDVSPDTWTLDPDLLASEMARAMREDRLPKAVVPTDLFGQSCDIDRIVAVCEPYGVAVVTDSAEAVGATYKDRMVGASGTAAVFSFNGNKIITTSGGGILASRDRELVTGAKFLSQQARDPAPHYEHSMLGYNYRMSSICAAIGRGQLTALETRIAERRAIFERYHAGLKDLAGLTFMPEAGYGQSTRWLTVVLIDPAHFGRDREYVRMALEAQDIETRPVWKPMHLQPVFTEERVVGGAVSEELFAKGLCLPSGSSLTIDKQNRIIELIRAQVS
jgi:dTDP-4-amino-4,6-dideoxygalactose transaminase